MKDDFFDPDFEDETETDEIVDVAELESDTQDLFEEDDFEEVEVQAFEEDEPESSFEEVADDEERFNDDDGEDEDDDFTFAEDDENEETEELPDPDAPPAFAPYTRGDWSEITEIEESEEPEMSEDSEIEEIEESPISLQTEHEIEQIIVPTELPRIEPEELKEPAVRIEELEVRPEIRTENSFVDPISDESESTDFIDLARKDEHIYTESIREESALEESAEPVSETQNSEESVFEEKTFNSQPTAEIMEAENESEPMAEAAEAESVTYDGEHLESDGKDEKIKIDHSVSSDLIRGHINTIILRSLYDGDKYGYEIKTEIEKKSRNQYSIKEPSLYSALKRLEKDGYVTSYWGGSVSGGRRKYFSLTDEGKAISERNQSEWEYSRTVIDNLISDREYDFSSPAPTAVDMRVLRRSTTRVSGKENLREEYEYFDEPEPYESAEMTSVSTEQEQTEQLSSERAALEEEHARREEALREREEMLRIREEAGARREQDLLEREFALQAAEARREEEERLLEEERLRLEEEQRLRQEEEERHREEERLRLEEELRIQPDEEESFIENDPEPFMESQEAVYEDTGAIAEPAWQEAEIREQTQEEQQRMIEEAQEIARQEERERVLAEVEAEKLRLRAEEEERARLAEEQQRLIEQVQESARQEERERIFAELEAEREKSEAAQRQAEMEEARHQAEVELARMRAEAEDRERRIAEQQNEIERARAMALNSNKNAQNERIVHMEPFAEERALYEDRLRQQAEEFERFHAREIAETEKRVRAEDEENFRRRANELRHQNYIDLVRGVKGEQSPDDLYTSYYYGETPSSKIDSYRFGTKPEKEREYRSAIERLYYSTIHDEEFDSPAPVQTPPPPPVYEAPAASAESPTPSLKAAEKSEAPSDKKPRTARALDGIDFYDLEIRAAQDGIRINLAGDRKAKSLDKKSDSLVHKGRALFLSALLVFLLCFAEGSLSLGLRTQFDLPIFYPIFFWGVGSALLLVTALMWINRYGERALRQTGNLMVNIIVTYALCVIVILIVALARQIDFTSINELMTNVIVPAIFCFNIVIFGVTYFLQVRPNNEV